MTRFRILSWIAILTLPLVGCWRSMGSEETSATCYARVDCLPGEDCEEGVCTCNPEKCEGCCGEDNRCYNGESDDACGLGGGACQQCVGEDCSEGGVCVCDPAECEGCCGEDDQCHSEQTVDLCGLGGDECLQCEDFQMCSDGACVCNPEECTGDYMCSDAACVCDPDTCGGCCSANGRRCRSGTVEAACGVDGEQCKTCTIGEICADGSCDPGEPCDDPCDALELRECLSSSDDSPYFLECMDIRGCLEWYELSCEPDEVCVAQDEGGISCEPRGCAHVQNGCPDEEGSIRCSPDSSIEVQRCEADGSGCLRWVMMDVCEGDGEFCYRTVCSTCDEFGTQCENLAAIYPYCDPEDLYALIECKPFGDGEECYLEVSTRCVSDDICRSESGEARCDLECPSSDFCNEEDEGLDVCTEEQQVRRCTSFERENDDMCYYWSGAEDCDISNLEIRCRVNECCENECDSSSEYLHCDEATGLARECVLSENGCWVLSSDSYNCNPADETWLCSGGICSEACNPELECWEGVENDCQGPNDTAQPLTRYECVFDLLDNGVECWQWVSEDCSEADGFDYCLAGHCLECPEVSVVNGGCSEVGNIVCGEHPETFQPAYRQCVETAVGCPVWSSWRECNVEETCTNMVGCINDCVPECDFEGQTQCETPFSMQVCVPSTFSNPENCLIWSEPIHCADDWYCEGGDVHCMPY